MKIPRNFLYITVFIAKDYDLITVTSSEFDEWLLVLQQASKRDTKMDLSNFMNAIKSVKF